MVFLAEFFIRALTKWREERKGAEKKNALSNKKKKYQKAEESRWKEALKSLTGYLIDMETGEILTEKTFKDITPTPEKWWTEILYSAELNSLKRKMALMVSWFSAKNVNTNFQAYNFFAY